MEVEEIDEEFNIKSEQFNALKVLQTVDFRVTIKKPKIIYQNMAALESAIKRVGVMNLNKRDKQKREVDKKAPKTQVVKEPNIIRRFQEHQMAQTSTVHLKHRHERNILKQINEITCGPMNALRNYVENKVRVKVLVRREHGVKGHLEGVLQCFDRFWNLLLTNVTEQYVQRKTKYSEQKVADLPVAIDCSQHLLKLGLSLPLIKNTRSIKRKNIEITRILPQTFIRGEHVVLIYSNERKII